MFPCIVVGDSIAVGVGQVRPDCQTFAKSGITTSRYISDYLPSLPRDAETAVISLGVNDDATVHTMENLRSVRARLGGARVYWLLPGLKPEVRAAIRTVAAENGDRWIDTGPQAGPDHLHPTGSGYRVIASRTEGDGIEEVAAAPPAVEAAEPRTRRRHGPLTPVERIHRLRLMRQEERSPRGHREASHSARHHAEGREADGGRHHPERREVAETDHHRHGRAVSEDHPRHEHREAARRDHPDSGKPVRLANSVEAHHSVPHHARDHHARSDSNPRSARG